MLFYRPIWLWHILSLQHNVYFILMYIYFILIDIPLLWDAVIYCWSFSWYDIVIASVLSHAQSVFLYIPPLVSISQSLSHTEVHAMPAVCIHYLNICSVCCLCLCITLQLHMAISSLSCLFSLSVSNLIFARQSFIFRFAVLFSSASSIYNNLETIHRGGTVLCDIFLSYENAETVCLLKLQNNINT